MKIEEYIMHLAEKYGKSKTWAVNEFADMCNISLNTMNNYTRKTNKHRPSLKTIKKIIMGSGGKITIEDLMED